MLLEGCWDGNLNEGDPFLGKRTSFWLPLSKVLSTLVGMYFHMFIALL